MKFFISFFIIFTIAIRPVLPLINYAVNYEYIVKNLCEKKDIIDSTCKGKCFVSKELVKTEKQNTSRIIKISVLDVFLSSEIFSFSNINNAFDDLDKENSLCLNNHHSEYFSKIFHPPVA
ncbi:hypothetical protein NZ698_11730 [Chryseobacterium sp. PBS4-4]|uniref:Uncharacterized protein n=1 Tax=Chryseobacterium edaphi TaxID=2976532 RepID=A0ABT2W6N2_9FLAO|nr:hypothetical protein [Chryseobacterium edaphi]MCU7617871.1 hypothetical protein [Chryseobacterium edaphi]